MLKSNDSNNRRLGAILDALREFHKGLANLISGYGDYLRINYDYKVYREKYDNLYTPTLSKPGDILTKARKRMSTLISKDTDFAKKRGWLESLDPERNSLFRLVNNEIFTDKVKEDYGALPKFDPNDKAGIKAKKETFATAFVKNNLLTRRMFKLQIDAFIKKYGEPLVKEGLIAGVKGAISGAKY